MLKNPSCAICYHDMYYIDGFNNKKGNAFSSYHPPKRGKLDIFLKSAPFSFTTSIMIKSADMPEHGFLKEFPVWSDRLMLIEVLEKGGEIDYIDEVLGSYRTHGSNISTIRDSNKFAEYLASLAWTLGKHPQYVRNFKYKTSMAFFLNRKMNSCRDYSVYLRAALGIRFFWKSVVGLLVYYISFKKITL